MSSCILISRQWNQTELQQKIMQNILGLKWHSFVKGCDKNYMVIKLIKEVNDYNKLWVHHVMKYVQRCISKNFTSSVRKSKRLAQLGWFWLEWLWYINNRQLKNSSKESRFFFLPTSTLFMHNICSLIGVAYKVSPDKIFGYLINVHNVLVALLYEPGAATAKLKIAISHSSTYRTYRL